MIMAETKHRSTDPDENLSQHNSPERGTEKRKGEKHKNKERKGSSSMATRENTNIQGYGSSQRNDDLNIGPMDAEFDELPSKRRSSENNQTGPGLG